MAEISVIIPVYNTGKYLSECLDSVVNQTFKDIEIICINDGSTDNSAEILKEYAKKDKRIKVINQKNSGVVTARNNGISKAKGEYIYPLDSDDVIVPDCLEKLHKAITRGKGDIITNRVMYFGEETGEMILPKPNKYNMALGNCFVNAALFRKKDFQLTGGYSTKFNIALEDYDLWLNMMFNHNKKVYRVNKILFYYRQKPHDEARNHQNRSVHHQLLIDMFKQYPQIKKYIVLSKIIKPLKKIRRFFFRIENKKVKVLKICIFHINHRKEMVNIYHKFILFFVRIFHSIGTYNRYKMKYLGPTYQLITNPKLIMTLLVKNEQDIIEENLIFHKAMGIDGFIVTDNCSTDKTKEILLKYQKKGWILKIITEKSQTYSQSDWVHRMDVLARDIYKADWIINADADEFWYARSGNLKTELSRSRANLIFVPIFNMRDNSEAWINNIDMIFKSIEKSLADKLIEDGLLSKFNQFGMQIPKVCIRMSEYVYIHMGNHYADMKIQHNRIVSEDIVIYHYNSRGAEQFKQKIIIGGKAFERNKKFGKDVGVHIRYFYEGFKKGILSIEEEYKKTTGTLCLEQCINLTRQDTAIRDFFLLHDIEEKFPKIMSFKTMLGKIKTGASIARFGDAEFDIALQRNKEDPYQKPNDRLSNSLFKILKTPSNDKLIICIPPFNAEHNNVANFRDGLSFWKWYWKERWSFLSPLFVNKEYGDSFFSRDSVFYELNLDDLKSIWENKEVCFIVPENGRFEYDTRLFDNIKTKSEIFIPATNAFDEYDNILKQCKKYNKHTLFFIAAGPTATVLAVELSSLGYQALDMGHFTNCYRQFLGETKSPESYPLERKK